MDLLYAQHLSDIRKTISLPDKIYFAYFTTNHEPLFHEWIINGQPIPVFCFVSNLKKHYEPLMNEMHLPEYALGFIQGVKYDFLPMIDTPQNRKELVLHEVVNRGQFGFPERVKKNGEKHFNELDVYQYGIDVGKMYKAWSIVIETPKYFEDGFPDLKMEPANRKEQKKAADKKCYSLKQVCIAYHFMENVTITNAAKLLRLHTRYTSIPKLLQKVVTKTSDLTKLSEYKRTDTLRLKDLEAAKRLISGKKDSEALKRITHIITQFQTSYNNYY